MSYDEALADRVRIELADQPGLDERRMSGGLAFLINRHVALCAISSGALMLRVDPACADALLAKPYVQRFVMRGQELAGWLHIDSQAITADAWIVHAVAYARSLPPKEDSSTGG